MTVLAEFTVYGQARPAGALKIGNRKDGRSYLFHRDSKTLSEWKNAISLAAAEASDGQPYRGAIRLCADFYVSRPKGHFGARGLRPSAPAYPTKRSAGDADKLGRALGDALTGILFADDSQIVDMRLRKLFADDGPARLVVVVSGEETT